jgi:hypothetical protein
MYLLYKKGGYNMLKKTLSLTTIIALSTVLNGSFGHAETFRCPTADSFVKNGKNFYIATADGITYISGYKPTKDAKEIQVYGSSQTYGNLTYMDCYYEGKTHGVEAKSQTQNMFSGRACVIRNTYSKNTTDSYTSYKCYPSCEVDCH